MSKESEPEADVTPLPPPTGKRGGEDENEEQVTAKKQKSDETVEEQKNKEEMNADYSEYDGKPEAEKSEPAIVCGSVESLDDGGSESEPDSNRSSDEDNPVNDMEISDYNEEEIGEKVSSIPQETHETPTTLKEKYAASKTIVVRNLPYSVERADMESLFKDCGEVVDVRFNLDREGKFRGFGHVDFGTAEAAHKALELDNTELLRRRIKVGITLGKDDCFPSRSSFHKGERFQSHSESAKGFDTSLVENKPKTTTMPDEKIASSRTIYVRNLAYTVKRPDMEKLFKNYGEIVDIRLHTDRNGLFKGFGHVEYATSEAAQKALELDNTEFWKRRIFIGLARDRGEYMPNRSWSSSFQKDERLQSQSVPVKCCDTPLMEDKLTCPTEVKDMEVFDAASAENKVTETRSTQKETNAASKTICLRNLSYGVERADIENLFKDCGEIFDVRLHVDVEFATAEAAEKASKLDYTELLNHPTKVGIAPEKGEYFPNRSWSNSFQQGERFHSLTVFVAGFNTSLSEDKIKASLEQHFRPCGEITRISIPKFIDSGASKGYAHLDFKGFDGYTKALQLNQTELGGYRLSVEKARPKQRRDTQGIGGGGSYHFGERDGSDHGGRVSWGDNQGISSGRGSGGGSYNFGGRDGGHHGGRVGWGDNQGIGRRDGGGNYHNGGTDGGDHGGRVGWLRSHDAGRHWTWTANMPNTDRHREENH